MGAEYFKKRENICIYKSIPNDSLNTLYRFRSLGQRIEILQKCCSIKVF